MKFCLTLLFLFVLATSVLAHKVNIFAYVDGQTVFAESYYPDGRPVVAGKVQVLDTEQQLLLQGVTDAEGLFQFALPAASELVLEVDAGMGHRNSYLLKQQAMDNN